MMKDRTLTVIGNMSVGKSALTIRFIEKKFSAEYDPTISRTYLHRLNVNNIDYHLTVYDTAGLEKQSQIPSQYFNSHGFILVYSIADTESFRIIHDIYNNLVDELGRTDVPIVLIGNKSDLNGQRCVEYEAGKELVAEWIRSGSPASFIETSALTGDKVEDVFVTLLNLVDKPANNQQHNQSSTQQQPERTQRPNDRTKCIIS